MILNKKYVIFAMMGLSAVLPLSAQAKGLLSEMAHVFKGVQHSTHSQPNTVHQQDVPGLPVLQKETDLRTPNLCPQHYPLGAPVVISIEKDKIARRSFYLCEDNYAVQFDPATKTPLWVSERLIGAEQAGRNEPRVDNFQPHPLVPKAAQASLNDYKGSKFDRGHMAPAADMLQARSMEQSFYLTNIVPQVGPNMNRGIWADLEAMARKWSESRSEVLVVTGPIFNLQHQSQTMGHSNVLIPTHLYKIVLDPRTSESLAFIMPNQQIVTRKTRSLDQGNPEFPQTTPSMAVNCGNQCTIDDFIVPLSQVEAATGLSFFPKLNQQQKQIASQKGRMWSARK